MKQNQPAAPSPATTEAEGPKRHRWNQDGETCLDCGQKDWMRGSVCTPASPPAAQEQKPVAWRDGVDWQRISKIVAEVIDDYELECEGGAVRKLTEDEKTAAIEVAADLTDNEDFHLAYAVASPIPYTQADYDRNAIKVPADVKVTTTEGARDGD